LTAPLRWPLYRRLWLSQVLSEIGDWAARLGLSALVYDRTGSALMGSLAFVAGLLPALGVGQWLSTYADRHGRRMVMVGCDLLRALIFGVLALPVDWPPAVALLGAMVAGVATIPFESARAAAVIDVCEAGPDAGTAGRVVAAVTLGQLSQDLATMLGYLTGGAMLVGWGPAGGLAVDAATFMVSAGLLAGLPPILAAPQPEAPQPEAPQPEAPRIGAWPRLRAAARALTAEPLLRRSALLASLAVATGTAVQSLVVPFVGLALPGREWLSGAALAAAAGTAMLVTVGLPGGIPGARALRWTAVLCLLPAGSGALLAIAPVPLIALAGAVCTGGLFAALVPAVALVAPRLPAELRATCFGLLTAALTAMQGTLCLLAGLLSGAFGPARAMVVVSVPVALAGAAALLLPDSAPVRGRRRAPKRVLPRAVESARHTVWTPATRHRWRAAVHARGGVPLAVSRPAPVLYRLNGPALQVRGRQVSPGSGAVLGVAFWVEMRPTPRQVLSHLLDPHASVHRRSTVTAGASVDSFEAAGAQDAARSLEAAVAVAASTIGEPVAVTGSGCRVDEVIEPVAGRVVDLTDFTALTGRTDVTDVGALLPGDVIVRIGETRTDTAADLRRVLAGRTMATFGVRRPGVPGVLEVHRRLRDDGSWGFSASTHRQEVRSALDVSLDLPDGSFGPSLGLGVTLGLLDLLGHRRPPGLTGGLHVAVTGSVLPDGVVGAVGGLVQKARAVACHRQVAAFVIPAGNADQLAVVRRVLPGRSVLLVQTVADALDALDGLSLDGLSLDARVPRRGPDRARSGPRRELTDQGR